MTSRGETGEQVDDVTEQSVFALREVLRMIDTQLGNLQSDRAWVAERLEDVQQLGERARDE